MTKETRQFIWGLILAFGGGYLLVLHITNYPIWCNYDLLDFLMAINSIYLTLSGVSLINKTI